MFASPLVPVTVCNANDEAKKKRYLSGRKIKIVRELRNSGLGFNEKRGEESTDTTSSNYPVANFEMETMDKAKYLPWEQ